VENQPLELFIKL